MARESVPDDVRRFILTSISSVPYLEAMLLMRNEPEEAWDARKVAQRLYMSEKAAALLLAELHEAAIATKPSQETPGYLYRPDSKELVRLIDRLAETYAIALVPISNLIHSKTSKKAQHFADAFKWRKD